MSADSSAHPAEPFETQVGFQAVHYASRDVVTIVLSLVVRLSVREARDALRVFESGQIPCVPEGTCASAAETLADVLATIPSHDEPTGAPS